MSEIEKLVERACKRAASLRRIGEYTDAADLEYLVSQARRVEELEGALRPFAEVSQHLDDLEPEHHILLRPRQYASERSAIPVADFRAARSALAKAAPAPAERRDEGTEG